MKLIITGGAGFVGSTLALALRARHADWEILAIDNFIRPGSETNRGRLKKAGISLRHADLRIQSDLDALPAADWVIDAAANASVMAGVDGLASSRQLVEHNLSGTIHLLEYCKRHRAGFLLLSTSRVYSIAPLSSLLVSVHDQAFLLNSSSQTLPSGVSAAGVSETFSTRPPVSLYGTTKLCSEQLALEYGAAFGFPVFVNRCGNLAGAGQFGRIDQGIFAFWINAWLQKRPLKYIGFDGQGHQVRDCLHPEDLASLLESQLADSARESGLWNVSGGVEQSISLRQLSRWCEKRFGSHSVEVQPQNRPFDIPWMVLDAGAAMKRWNWKPQRTLNAIFSEIADHAEQHPDWLSLSEG